MRRVGGVISAVVLHVLLYSATTVNAGFMRRTWPAYRGYGQLFGRNRELIGNREPRWRRYNQYHSSPRGYHQDHLPRKYRRGHLPHQYNSGWQDLTTRSRRSGVPDSYAKTRANYQNLPGRHGQGYNEIIRELEHSLRVSIPQLYANEKFNLRIEDQTLLHVSSQLTGYSKTFRIPSSVDINSAMYGYKDGYVWIDIPKRIVPTPDPGAQPQAVWGGIRSDDRSLKHAGPRHDDGLQIEEHLVLEDYPPDSEAVDGYFDVRGEFRSY